ncbi:MAG: hypothetical protein RIK00_09070 [Algiphilus sp.]|uniref:hypothetical protein n=1 Tax=Algiphilus sp. TaxID=1872431 RepID=UPI0032F07CC3
MKRMTLHPALRNAALALLLATGSTLALTGCESDGPAEEMGEDIDEGIEEAQDEIDDATDEE